MTHHLMKSPGRASLSSYQESGEDQQLKNRHLQCGWFCQDPVPPTEMTEDENPCGHLNNAPKGIHILIS